MKTLFSLILAIVVTQLAFAQSRDTSFVLDLPTSKVHITSTYSQDHGIVTVHSYRIQCAMNLPTEVVDSAIKSEITSDGAIINLIYNSDCKLVDFNFKKKSTLDSYNKFVGRFFEEFKTAFNAQSIGRFVSIDLEHGSCGMSTIPLKFAVK